jgi:hypothetical protein
MFPTSSTLDFYGPDRFIAVTLSIFCKREASSAGWPDWANFRLLGDCLFTLGSFLITDVHLFTFSIEYVSYHLLIE